MPWIFSLALLNTFELLESESATACSADTLIMPSWNSLPGVACERLSAMGTSALLETSDRASIMVRAALMSLPYTGINEAAVHSGLEVSAFMLSQSSSIFFASSGSVEKSPDVTLSLRPPTISTASFASLFTVFAELSSIKPLAPSATKSTATTAAIMAPA